MVKKTALLKEDLQVLQCIFREPSDEPMYDAYDITGVEEEAMRKAGLLEEALNFELYDYELYASQV